MMSAAPIATLGDRKPKNARRTPLWLCAALAFCFLFYVLPLHQFARSTILLGASRFDLGYVLILLAAYVLTWQWMAALALRHPQMTSLWASDRGLGWIEWLLLAMSAALVLLSLWRQTAQPGDYVVAIVITWGVLRNRLRG